MGLKPFTARIDAVSPQEAYMSLYNDALKTYGDSPTSGTIATCEFGECKGEFERYLLYNENKAMNIINELDCGEAGIAHFIDLGQVRWRIKTLMQTIQRYTSTYRQKFAVTDEDGNILEPVSDHIFGKKSEADKKAIKIMMAGQFPSVKVRKTYVRLSGNDVMSIYEWDIKYQNTKTPPKRATRKYSIVEPVHKYLFFGKAKT